MVDRLIQNRQSPENLTQELDALRNLLTATIRDLGLEHPGRRPRANPDAPGEANQR